MSRKSAIFLTSTLVSVGLIANPLAAEAAGLTRIGTSAKSAVLDCGGMSGGQSGGMSHSGGSGPVNVYKPVTNQSFNVFSPTGGNNNFGNNNINVQNNGGNSTIINKPINVQTNIDSSKNININKPVTVNNNNVDIKNVEINKPVTINNNIDSSKNININKPVTVNNNINNVKNVEINKSVEIYKPITIIKSYDNSKTIDNSKNININKNINNNKNININKNIDASKNININKNVNININANTNINSNSNNNTNTNTTTVTDNSVSNSTSNSYSTSTSTGFASAFADSSSNAVSSSLGGGDISVTAVGGGGAAAAVEASTVDYVAKGGQCTYTDATVVKAIHAICVSADGREFPASHMVGTSWIASGYEGEIARCLPGSTLKVMIGSVVQSDQGMATSMNGAQALTCGVRQAVRHYKDGMLKCAPAVKVVDCTERTNLRKWGTSDMFFSYVTKVCLEQTFAGGRSHESADQAAARARQAYSQSSSYSSFYSYGSADKAISLRGQHLQSGNQGY